MIVSMDDRFKEHFKNLNQVFLCITNGCNLACHHCLYKPWLRKNDDMDPEVAIALLDKFHEMGAYKLSLLGGEPTIYGQSGGRLALPDIIKAASNIGYEYTRVVTNGQFDKTLLSNKDFKSIDELSFSFDGITESSHDAMRGKGVFNRALNNVNTAIDAGIRVDFTMCVHAGSFDTQHTAAENVENMIFWAAEKGACRVNFHPVLEMGIARDIWVGNNYILPQDWIDVFDIVSSRSGLNKYPIPVRIPQRFVAREEFNRKPSYYGHCPVKLGERIEIHPHGQIQVCALLKGTPTSIAIFRREKDIVHIEWANDNELDSFPFDFHKDHPCAVISKNYGNYVPMCISNKPYQDEIVWKRLKLEES